MPDMHMTGGQASIATSIPSVPAMDHAMSGMDTGNQQSPTARPPEEGQGSSSTAMDMGGSLMADEPVSSAGVSPATENESGQLLPFKLDGDVKVFELAARPVLWKINADTQMTA